MMADVIKGLHKKDSKEGCISRRQRDLPDETIISSEKYLVNG